MENETAEVSFGFLEPELANDEGTVWAFVYASLVISGTTPMRSAEQATHRVSQLRELARAMPASDHAGTMTARCLRDVTGIASPAEVEEAANAS